MQKNAAFGEGGRTHLPAHASTSPFDYAQGSAQRDEMVGEGGEKAER